MFRAVFGFFLYFYIFYVLQLYYYNITFKSSCRLFLWLVFSNLESKLNMFCVKCKLCY